MIKWSKLSAKKKATWNKKWRSYKSKVLIAPFTVQQILDAEKVFCEKHGLEK